MHIARVGERLPRLQIQFRISRSFRPRNLANLGSKIRFWIRRKEHTRRVFYGQVMVMLMSGNSAGRRHFGFVQVAHCAWAGDKATDRSSRELTEVKIQLDWPVSCEQSENIEQFLVN